jgi:arylsulfatase A-like enzyme
MRLRSFVASVCLSATVTCPVPAQAVQDKVVVIILDDIGPEWLSAYKDLTNPTNAPQLLPPNGYPATPGIDKLKQYGVKFMHAWASPWCSSTRTMLNTGSYPFRTGIGNHLIQLPGGDPTSIYPRDLADLVHPNRELSIARLAHLTAYPAGCFGKWHMSGSEEWGGAGSPASTTAGKIVDSGRFEFDRFYGHLFGLSGAELCAARGFSASPGSPVSSIQPNGYFLCDGLDKVKSFLTSNQHFVCYYAPLAPFDMMYRPPATSACNTCGFPLYSTTLSNLAELQAAVTDQDRGEAYHALIETVDTMVNQILLHLDSLSAPQKWYDTTTVILLGDNGTPDLSNQVNYYWPSGRVKGTTYEGGIRVPFFIAGKAVDLARRNTSCITPVTIADLFPTVAELIGASSTFGRQDGTSLVASLQDNLPVWPPVGRTIYSETFSKDFSPVETTIASGVGGITS